jgi:Protein of unknown function (DUF3301)
MQELTLIGLLIAIGAYWWDAIRSNEIALRYCLGLCERAQVQLLDASVSCQRVWLRRRPGGGIQLCRLYSFEYSGDNHNRRYGYIVLIGREVVETRPGPNYNDENSVDSGLH